MNSHTHTLPRRIRALSFVPALVLGFFGRPSAFAVSEPSALTGQKQSYAYSWQQEMKEGADADREITQQMGLYDNPRIQAYVDEIGHRVLAASTFSDASTPAMYRDTKFVFRVLDSSVVNAFALPGGYVYVTRGLLAHVDNEAQLAVVLGHEIGHVAARHSSQQARRSQWAQLGVLAGSILGQAVLGDRMPNLGENVASTGSQAMQVFMLRYSREAENEADTLGVTYALQAGYAAEQSARFFDALRRLEAQQTQTLPTWMSTHPDPGNRADHVMALVNQHRASGPTEHRVGEAEFLHAVDGLIVGDDPRQGFTQAGIFYHPTLHFQLPVAPNWTVDNQPAAVVFHDPSGNASLALRVAPANRTHDAAQQFTAENKIQVTASGDTVVNGLPTTVIVGRANGQSGQLGVWDAFIELEGKVYSLMGYTPLQNFEAIRPQFESIASGFSALRDPQIANVQPAHLRIVRADRPAPFASYVPTSLPPKMNAETIAIMNQVNVNEVVPAGAELKIPDGSPANLANSAPAVLATVPQSPEPANGYPAQSYPPSYPTSTTYPTNSYPPASPYPSSSTTYPTWPQTSGPGDQRNANAYPPAYPSQPSQSSNGYPAQNYPSSSTYPGPNGYPGSSAYPQYPASPPPTNSYPPVQTPNGNPGDYPAQPTWPR